MAFDRIVGAANDSTQSAGQITLATRQQTSASGQVVLSMGGLRGVTNPG
jgi:methyl-accepting chemotaxis protein